ncbi:MAG: hypothetical protein U9N30_03165 [Campylobacterota bacterium]|nr:hypothetical protein [Campylobacterota bacterium]
MSMSQEEIEALMNGLDTDDAKPEPEVQETPVVEEDSASNNDEMSEDDIEDLIAQTQLSQETPQEQEIEEAVQNEVEPESKPAIEEEPVQNEELSQEEVQEEIQEENIDDLLAGVDGIEEDIEKTEPVDDSKHDEIGRDWTDKQIDNGVFPMPVEKNTKVVEQLSEVASDSEEKASKIFDVLSFIMDENVVIEKNSKELEEFVKQQTALLETLTQKFPNIALFQENLEMAQALQGKGDEIASKVNAENMQLFSAMELMQFHDINRQKIERVMSVIRKLSNYLNGIFEDDGSHEEVAVARHIHGDDNSNLVGDDDMDALIAEFGN